MGALELQLSKEPKEQICVTTAPFSTLAAKSAQFISEDCFSPRPAHILIVTTCRSSGWLQADNPSRLAASHTWETLWVLSCSLPNLASVRLLNCLCWGTALGNTGGSWNIEYLEFLKKVKSVWATLWASARRSEQTQSQFFLMILLSVLLL